MKLLTVAFFLSLAFSASAAPRPSCLEECSAQEEDGYRLGCLKKAKEGTRVEDWHCYTRQNCLRKGVLYDVTFGPISSARNQMRGWCQDQGME